MATCGHQIVSRPASAFDWCEGRGRLTFGGCWAEARPTGDRASRVLSGLAAAVVLPDVLHAGSRTISVAVLRVMPGMALAWGPVGVGEAAVAAGLADRDEAACGVLARAEPLGSLGAGASTTRAGRDGELPLWVALLWSGRAWEPPERDRVCVVCPFRAHPACRCGWPPPVIWRAALSRPIPVPRRYDAGMVMEMAIAAAM